MLFIDDGDVLTSAGVAAGIDLCLHIVRRDHGTAVANDVARRTVVPPHRDGGQAQYIQRPVPDAQLATTTKARAWALARLHEPIQLRDMAEQESMSVRTFTRRFREEAGISPGQWLVQQRVERARHLLEATDLSVDRIARDAGFGTAQSMRQHLQAALGVAPTVYRRTFRAVDGGRAGVTCDGTGENGGSQACVTAFDEPSAAAGAGPGPGPVQRTGRSPTGPPRSARARRAVRAPAARTPPPTPVRTGPPRTRSACPSPPAASPTGRRARRPAQAPPVGVLALRMARRGRTRAGVGDLDPYGPGLGGPGTEEHPQHGRTAGVHHGVGDELGDQQDQRLRQWLVVVQSGADEPRPRPSTGPADLRRIGSDLQLHLKNLHRSHHPNRRAHRLAPRQGPRQGHRT